MTETIANKLKSLYDNLVIAINFINEGINLKADKVSSATSGNFAGLDNTGNLTDSGKKASDFAPASGSTNYAAVSHTHAQSDITGLATDLAAKADKTTTLNVASSVSAQALSPNVLYTFLERTTNLTLRLTAGLLTEANEYHFFLIIGSTAPTITWPTGISWNGGSAPTIAADKTYEVSILNNVAAFIEIDNPEEESES